MADASGTSSVDGIDLSNLTSGSRARKSVKRMRVDESTVLGGSKPTLNVLEGPGTEVKNLINVCKHLAAVSGNIDLLKTLHRLMYGKFAKPDVVLSNIMRFSGLPFRNEELYPRGYDESYDSLMFRVNDLKVRLHKKFNHCHVWSNQGLCRCRCCELCLMQLASPVILSLLTTAKPTR